MARHARRPVRCGPPRRGRIACTASLAILTLAATALAQDRPAVEALEPVLGTVREKGGVPALGGAIVRGGRLVAVGAVGVRARGAEAAVTRDDLWHLGSCTKAMTATLLVRLEEQGKLRLDTPLGEAFPKLDPKVHEAYRKVPLVDLLAHRGGMPADLSGDGLWARLWERKGTPSQQRMQLVRGVLPREPAHRPGSAYLYSNAGYAVAGAYAEVKLGSSWEELLRTDVFAPLGMDGAGFGAPGTAGKDDQPLGHPAGAESTAVPVGPAADNPPAIGPAGTVHASLADWARFVAAHLRGARGEEKEFLSADGFRRLHTPLPAQGGPDYALGWIVAERPWAAGRVLTHSGSNTMWFAVTWIAPEKDLAVLVTCNQGGDEAAKACDDAASALIRHALR